MKLFDIIKSKFRKRYLKKSKIYSICLVISIVIIILFSTQLSSVLLNLINPRIPIQNLKIYDLGATVALIVGILSFYASLYTSDKNYKAMKLSAIPDTSTNLLIDLEYIFNKYELYKDDKDEFIVLIKILEYWKEHQKAIRLLTPHFYKEFLKILTSKETINDTDLNSVKNSKYILMAMKSQITNIAFEQETGVFSFIDPNLIRDDIDISELGDDLDNYTDMRFTKNDLNEYVGGISGVNTKKLTKTKFRDIEVKFKNLLDDLKKEIEEYD